MVLEALRTGRQARSAHWELGITAGEKADASAERSQVQMVLRPPQEKRRYPRSSGSLDEKPGRAVLAAAQGAHGAGVPLEPVQHAAPQLALLGLTRRVGWRLLIG